MYVWLRVAICTALNSGLYVNVHYCCHISVTRISFCCSRLFKKNSHGLAKRRNLAHFICNVSKEPHITYFSRYARGHLGARKYFKIFLQCTDPKLGVYFRFVNSRPAQCPELKRLDYFGRQIKWGVCGNPNLNNGNRDPMRSSSSLLKGELLI
jgi:hypothetical protein